MPAASPRLTSSLPLPWARAALGGGLVAGALGTLTIALGYYARFPKAPPIGTWGESAATIALVGLLSGAALGLGIGGGVVVGRRRGGRGVAEVVGGALGGALSGILPSLIGVLGFGSLAAPYAGTDLAAIGVLVAAIVLGALLSTPAASDQESPLPRPSTLAASLLASALVIIPFGLTIAGLVGVALPLEVIRGLLDVFGEDSRSAFALGALSVGLAAVFGALVGAFVGLSVGLARLLRETWALLSRP
ncbi:MAG: hypothetical protein H6711_19665 [Myxococcales bacterium]|nr:hypothetical protein [Myxococcales bacterium]